ncbi:hypothetical protein IEQ34_017883 [Dendrobium chrysotoxum]|uniref:Uncharacterized protein n=1 Tax=Dendrobium chrysotoxum TaxID=161865 RepID=A0AAV7GCX0_DENCH|nr:hypothetical protein IEQ34_017883 [Dendrobium chrysotoxum]
MSDCAIGGKIGRLVYRKLVPELSDGGKALKFEQLRARHALAIALLHFQIDSSQQLLQHHLPIPRHHRNFSKTPLLKTVIHGGDARRREPNRSLLAAPRGRRILANARSRRFFLTSGELRLRRVSATAGKYRAQESGEAGSRRRRGPQNPQIADPATDRALPLFFWWRIRA